jgi:RNA recognition motif-containing protein
MQDHKNIQIISQDTKSVIVLSDLAENVLYSDLEIFFENYKDSILFIDFKPKFDFSSKTSSATIIFKDYKSADKARLDLNMRKIKGKTVRITWHEKDSSLRYGNLSNLYVKNIPVQVSPRQFFEFFLKFGDIISAKLAENEEGEHLGYGYIHFANQESVDKCVIATDDKEIWFNQKIKVEPFQKKNERTTSLNPNNSLFVKNFPSSFDEAKIKELFTGLNIMWMKVNIDERGRKTAFITFQNDEAASIAKLQNGKVIEDQELFVDNLMSKFERKKYLSTKISEKNIQLANQFKDCNLHVKNLPLEMNEEDLRRVFSKYGEVKSVKIKTQINSTKIKDKFVDTVVSCGYGYVCFTNQVDAKNAFDKLNGAFLDESNKKRPLELSYFTPVNERKSNMAKNYMNQRNIVMDNFYMNQQQKPIKHQQQQIQQFIQQKPVNLPIPAINTKPIFISEPDYVLIDSINDDSEKRDYLGEFIFKKIECHELTEFNKLTFDQIGKITGMILGIENIGEIIDICKNKDNLTSRINEALELLNKTG